MGHFPLKIEQFGAIHDCSEGTQWSSSELYSATSARANLLSDTGIRPGRYVVIAHGGTPAFFADLFATWRLGACAVCVNPELTVSELENVVGFMEPQAILPGDRLELGLVASHPGLITGHAVPGPPASPDDMLVDPRSTDAALVLFTSGTTGDPKGVVHTFGSLAARIELNRRFIERETLQRTLCTLPTHFGHGLIGNCLTPLAAGGDLFLAGGGGMAGAARLGAQIDAHDISFMSSVPSFWKMVLKLSRPPENESLKQLSVGSAPVSADLIKAIIEWSGTRDVRNMYGITETANWIAGASATEFEPEDGLIGRMWGGEAAVRLEDCTMASEGEGEIVVRTPSMMNGYYKRPDLTAEVINDRWYSTGDTGTIDSAGVIRLSGRIKNEINRAGMKVAPEEVDLLLERHPAVLEACAFGVADEIAGETVAVAVKLIGGENLPDSNDLRSWCVQRIRRDCVPERWYFLDEIPKTDRGKLNRDIVRQACTLDDSNE